MSLNNRILRINEDIQRELSALLRNVKDPRVRRQGMISVTAVDATTDLKQAKVYISVLAPESETELMKGLKSASGYLRSEIGKALNLRYTPELQFEIDDSIARGAKINTILNDLSSSSDSTIMLDTVQTADWLGDRDNFLLITHRRPDGDTLGSAAALTQGLREIGKTAYILPNPETTPRFLPFVEEYHASKDYKPEYIIAMDTASNDLFHDDATEYKGKVDLCIDHHDSNKKYAQYTCLDSSYASCGELVYDLLIELSDDISARTAECLYVAVSTDTGCFAYANTTANTLQTAALLVEAGAPQKELNKMLFRTKTHSRIKIEAMVYSGMEYYHDGRVAIMIITRDMMEEAGAMEDDIDDISAVPIAVEGVKLGITLRELQSGEIGKGSIRSVTGINANEIAARFGGGGHPMAAGFSFNKPIDEIKDKLLEVIPEFLTSE